MNLNAATCTAPESYDSNTVCQNAFKTRHNIYAAKKGAIGQKYTLTLPGGRPEWVSKLAFANIPYGD